MRFGYWRFLPAVLWTGFIIYGLASGSSGLPKFKWLQFQYADKLIHAVLFFGESVLIAAAIQFKLTSKHFIGIFLWCVLLGGSLEVIQDVWVSSRSGDMMDLIADTVGALIGLLLIRTITKK